MRRLSPVIILGLLGTMVVHPPRANGSELSLDGLNIVRRFVFDQDVLPPGWRHNPDITELKAGPDGLRFRARGANPMLISPLFEAFEATDNQCLIIKWEADDFGYGQVFYHDGSDGRHGGFK